MIRCFQTNNSSLNREESLSKFQDILKFHVDFICEDATGFCQPKLKRPIGETSIDITDEVDNEPISVCIYLCLIALSYDKVQDIRISVRNDKLDKFIYNPVYYRVVEDPKVIKCIVRYTEESGIDFCEDLAKIVEMYLAPTVYDLLCFTNGSKKVRIKYDGSIIKV